jgi:hypothetical protein
MILNNFLSVIPSGWFLKTSPLVSREVGKPKPQEAIPGKPGRFSSRQRQDGLSRQEREFSQEEDHRNMANSKTDTNMHLHESEISESGQRLCYFFMSFFLDTRHPGTSKF